MKKLLIFSLLSSSFFLIWCFSQEKIPENVQIRYNQTQNKNIKNNSWVTWSWESIKKDNSFFWEIKTESLWIGNYKITGVLLWDFKTISVVWSYNGKEDEPYILKKYVPEKRIFEYYIQPKFHTIAKWDNIYIFTWEKLNWEKESKEVKITEDKNIVLTGKYCVLDICIDDTKPYSKKWEDIIQELSVDDGNGKSHVSTRITLNLTKKSALMEDWLDEMWQTTTKITNYNTFYVRYSSTMSCGPTSWKQEIFDASWINISHSINTKLGVLQQFNIGNKLFKLVDLNADTSTYVYGTIQENMVVEKLYSKINKNIWIELLEEIKKNKELFPKRVILSFKEYPEIKFVYEMKNIQPERIIYLWTDGEYLSKNIDSVGNLLDIDVSNKILSYYTKDRRFINWNSIESWIEKMTKENGSFFRVEKLTGDWYYLLYPKTWYQFQSFAEMCKPVIYVYSKEQKDLNITVKIINQGFFTKLIPNFSMGTTWNIRSLWDSVSIDNKKYDYLYYSVKVAWYKFNKDWWIIQGNEVKQFFEDKLPKLWFKEKEQKDFIEFWEKEFKSNSYYFVSFKYNESMDKMVQLFFSEKPLSIERILFEGYEINKPGIEKQEYFYKNVGSNFDSKLLQKFERNNDFDIFEWGWVLMDFEKVTIR